MQPKAMSSHPLNQECLLLPRFDEREDLLQPLCHGRVSQHAAESNQSDPLETLAPAHGQQHSNVICSTGLLPWDVNPAWLHLCKSHYVNVSTLS